MFNFYRTLWKIPTNFTSVGLEAIPGTHMQYNTLGFKWLCKLYATHQVWCNWTGKQPAIPNDFIPPTVNAKRKIDN